MELIECWGHLSNKTRVHGPFLDNQQGEEWQERMNVIAAIAMTDVTDTFIECNPSLHYA
jgi:hypothetical protein